MLNLLRGGTVWILPALAMVAVVICPTQTAVAGGDSSDKLIDKPFEECLIKHFQTRFFNRIDATPEQRQKLSAIIALRADETRPLRAQLRQGLLELNEMMARPDVSDEQLTAKAQEVRDLRNQAMEQRLKSVLEARAVLTQEQRQLIAEKISGLVTGEWKHRFGGRQ